MSETITLGEAAMRLGISVRTARRWIHAGTLAADLQSGRYGPQYRIPVAAVASLQSERAANRPAATSSASLDTARAELRREIAQTWQELSQIQRELWQTCQALASARTEMQHLREELVTTREIIQGHRATPDGETLAPGRVSQAG